MLTAYNFPVMWINQKHKDSPNLAILLQSEGNYLWLCFILGQLNKDQYEKD